jgi:hypothetical protein
MTHTRTSSPLLRRFVTAVTGAAALGLMAAAAQASPIVGPTSRLYLASVSDKTLYALQGADIVGSTQTYCNHCEAPIAVAGDIRTTASFSGNGGQYRTDLTKTGVTYDSALPFNSPEQYADGATDGRRNYTVAYSPQNALPFTTVYGFNRDWAERESVFTLTSNTSAIGITYDPTNNSIWLLSTVRDDVGGSREMIQDYALDGTLLSQFASVQYGRSLALDYADGTLWAVRGNANFFDQYDKAGNLLQTVSYSSRLGNQGGFVSSEFDLGAVNAVPEPAGLIWLSLALAALPAARQRWRQRAGTARA